jgi:hypothetical protein
MRSASNNDWRKGMYIGGGVLVVLLIILLIYLLA